MSQTYDLVVIGAGAGGGEAATTALQYGAKVAMLEKDKLGGTCLSYGCDPTKTLIYTAKLLYDCQNANQYGLNITAVDLNWNNVMRRVKAVITTMRGGTEAEARLELSRKGIKIIAGEARFLSPSEVSIDGNKIQAKQFVIATGTQAIIPPVEGLEAAGFITNKEAVNLDKLPNSMAIVGGGAIGVEFAQMFHRFGVKITLIESNPHLLEQEDQEMVEQLQTILTEEGIKVETDTKLEQVQTVEGGKQLTLNKNGKKHKLTVAEILIATGRQPAIEALDLAEAGVRSNKEGIMTNRYLQTNVANIWAVGDVVAGNYPFTHVASEQGKLAVQNALGKTKKAFKRAAIGWVTFTDPNLARIGQTEAQLKEAGKSYRVLKFAMSENDSARTRGQTKGLVKLLADEKSGKLYGGHILAVEAGEMLAPLALAMRHNLTVSDLAQAILPYPTLTEAVRWAASQQ